MLDVLLYFTLSVKIAFFILQINRNGLSNAVVSLLLYKATIVGSNPFQCERFSRLVTGTLRPTKSSGRLASSVGEETKGNSVCQIALVAYCKTNQCYLTYNAPNSGPLPDMMA